MEQHFNQNIPAPENEDGNKHIIAIYFLIGLSIIATIAAIVLFGIDSKHLEDNSPIADEELICPEDDEFLELCTYLVFIAENPDFEIPEKLAKDVENASDIIANSKLYCPTDRKGLGACLADVQIQNMEEEIKERYLQKDRRIETVEKRVVEKRIPKLSEFQKAEKRWFDRFKTTDIPTNSYKAYYFDSTKPDVILKTEVVPRVAINYTWSEGDGFKVRSEDFGGFWVGNIVIDEPGTYVVSAAESRSDLKVIIDGRIIPVRGETKIAMEKGTYQVEVEYLNNWHGTDFAMSIAKETKEYSDEEIKEKISGITQDFDVWYVGAYESSNSNRTVTLNLKKTSSRPVVLLLSSYSQLNWKINNNSKVNVQYIIYSSYESGISVETDIDSKRILKATGRTLPSEYTIKASCYDTKGAVFHCENIDGLTKIDSGVQSLIGQKIDGFSGKYSADQLMVPEQVITESERTKILKSYEDIRKERQDYMESQKIENVF